MGQHDRCTLHLYIPKKMNTSSELPQHGRLIGIDYGSVRMGLAICDQGQSIASPLTVYVRRNERLDGDFFVDLVKKEEVVGWVVGLPIHLSGDESAKSIEAKKFGQWLGDTTQRPVTFFDERFTTAFAREALNQTHLSGKKRKAQLDKLAAQILLTAYLDRV